MIDNDSQIGNLIGEPDCVGENRWATDDIDFEICIGHALHVGDERRIKDTLPERPLTDADAEE